MKVTGYLMQLTYNVTQKELATFEIDGGIGKYSDELIGRKLEITIEQYKEKRSRNANAYMWELVSALAKQGFKDKVEIYREAVKAVGVFKDFYLRPEDAESFMWLWEHNGTAWLTEKLDYDEDGDTLIVRAYYGSSCYNKKQMSRLIDYLIEDARAVGIHILSEAERTLLLDNWTGAMRKDNQNE